MNLTDIPNNYIPTREFIIFLSGVEGRGSNIPLPYLYSTEGFNPLYPRLELRGAGYTSPLVHSPKPNKAGGEEGHNCGLCSEGLLFGNKPLLHHVQGENSLFSHPSPLDLCLAYLALTCQEGERSQAVCLSPYRFSTLPLTFEMEASS